jgi:uncharacterized delta-60 repeat protein
VKTQRVASIALSGAAIVTLASGAASATTVPPGSTVPADGSVPADAGTGAAVAPDPAFGTDGVLVANVAPDGHDRFISVAAAPDGAVYASGFVDVGDEDHAFVVSKFGPDGALDESYGDAGSAIVNVVEGGGDAEVARGLVLGDDGSVTVAGPVDHDPAAAEPDAEDADAAVVRLDATGALDTTFGEGGIAVFDLGAGKAVDEETYLADNAWGLTARDGGYALFASSPNQEADRVDTDFVIVGITDAGAVDEAFGTDGSVVVDVNATVDNARHVTVDDQGRILAVGYSRDGDGIVSPVLIRLSADGVLDESFGEGGVANHVVLDGVAEAYNVAFQGDAYVLSGYGRGVDEETVDQITYRFTADGAWDDSFGDGGVTRIDLAGQDDRGRNVTVLPDGHIVVVGSGKLDETNLDALVVLLDENGAPVADFGDNGALLIDLGGANDALFGIDTTDDGALLYVAGFKGAADDTDELDDAALLRFTLP